MKPIAKDRLESNCVEALNRVSRIRKVRAVKLGRSPIGTANWTLREVNPLFDINDVSRSHSVIRDLQREYRMVTHGYDW
jgi:hypothetical protein